MSGKTIGEVKAIVDHHYDQASFDPRLVEEGRGGSIYYSMTANITALPKERVLLISTGSITMNIKSV